MFLEWELSSPSCTGLPITCAMLSLAARHRAPSALSHGHTPHSRPSKPRGRHSLLQTAPGTRTLISGSSRDQNSLFPAKDNLGAKLSDTTRIRGTHKVRHGHHGHHSHHRFPQISGQHPQVDPRLFNKTSEEDHEHGTTITVYGIITNVVLSLGYETHPPKILRQIMSFNGSWIPNVPD